MSKSYCQRCHQPFDVTSKMSGPVVSCPNCKKLTALFFDPESTPLAGAPKTETSSWSRGQAVEPVVATPPKVVVWHPDAKVPLPPSPAVLKPKLVVQPVEKPRVFALADVATVARDLVANIEKVVVGKHEQSVLAVAAVMAGGHVLVEDLPGLGKTILARAIAVSTGCTFKRIQCTPDLHPADILGENYINPLTGRLEPRFGPMFPQMILVDEINRASPRTQAALLEAMGEAMVTIEQVTYHLQRPFMVIATQNSLDSAGTVSLAETQKDRFLLWLSLGYPELADEKQMMERFQKQFPIDTLKPVTGPERLAECQQAVREVRVASAVGDYILALVRATRGHAAVQLGASPRATLGLFRVAQAIAAMAGRDQVTAADVRDLAPLILRHRLTLRREEKFSGLKPDDVIQEIIAQTPLPA